ncbi:hypothetical protein Nepgr_012330 [Nepenthes gracilis]|uniref:Uncharacterized protein n=1 Tax=Nepenthes gracilis TaxID=150966 RepID=A0AAD3SH32_NEPGR|nr:hypothetical protein Nepgr_012330 [Nepenthes gracilis]
MAVAVPNRLHERNNHHRSFRFFKNIQCDSIVEIGGFAELRDYQEMRIGLVWVTDLQDVRVRREDMQDFRLLLEAFAVGGVEEAPFIDRLDSEESVGGGGAAAEDDAETTTADLFAELVVSLDALTQFSLSSTGPRGLLEEQVHGGRLLTYRAWEGSWHHGIKPSEYSLVHQQELGDRAFYPKSVKSAAAIFTPPPQPRGR